MSYLDGKSIYSIHYSKSPITTVENTEKIELHLPGSIMTITDTNTVHKILKWMKEASKGKFDTNEYVRFMLIEEDLI